MNGLLDNDSDSLSSCQHRVKARLHEILQKDCDFVEEDYDRVTVSFLSAFGMFTLHTLTLSSQNILTYVTKQRSKKQRSLVPQRPGQLSTFKVTVAILAPKTSQICPNEEEYKLPCADGVTLNL